MLKTVNMLVAVALKMAESSKTLATASTTVSSMVGTTPPPPPLLLFWEPSPLSGYLFFLKQILKITRPPPQPHLPISESHHEKI